MRSEDWRESGAVAAAVPATARGGEAAAPGGGEVGSAAHYKKMYDRISTLAKIGVWECELANERLTWTDTVYDLFDIERGAPLVRAETAALYAPESRLRMERLRAAAIA